MPSAKYQRSFLDEQADRGPNQSRQDVIGHMLGVMRMTVVQFGDDVLQRIQHIDVGSGIEVGGSQRRGRMQNNQMTNSRTLAIVLVQVGRNRFSDIEDLALAVGLNRESGARTEILN